MTKRLRRTWKDVYPASEDSTSEFNGKTFSDNLEQNESFIKITFRTSSDLVCRKIRFQADAPRKLVVYLSTLVDEQELNEQIRTSFVMVKQDHYALESEVVEGESMPVANQACASTWGEMIRLLLSGYAAVFTEGDTLAVCFKARVSIRRAFEEPSSEPAIRGTKEGFVERQYVNFGMLRHYIRSPRLKSESFIVGDLTQTNVLVVYIEGIADDKVVDEVRKKIASIRIDGVLESGAIEEMIVEDRFPLLPRVQVTERPDVVAGSLLEGRVAIITDNTPFVLVVPVTFWTGMQSAEDYNLRFPVATFSRWIRFLFLIVAIFAPSFFVAVTSFHQEMIPTSLLLSIASAREPVPFPVMIETLLMEIMFEALREAGVRLPKAIGQTVSIVGGLVIGDAAVQAGIISTPSVIVVSTTGIAALLIPRFNFANGVRLLRFPMILLAGSFGLYGIALGFLGILLYVVHLKSFGVPYFTPIAPFSLRALKDVWARSPRVNDRNLSVPSSETAVKARRQEGGAGN
ncbi:spore germination protein [Paenibacillus harenae]|uniref:Spore germination protein KA n=1 Tax=Paenibacillus harenae TaxID=306543 RepID=A0ABT9U4I7_PAEHA|nr:spore germination protein [Paenibacillus harenae]MDQ0113903.1 spore germination protein KA [Paenibacillus harenae]